ncbi:MAG: hypothetical protein ACD_61C00093G0001 [uncultured bacterium]|nr:MAG: hypothetical protein ACD_61C00093G0001 [uncultured bacterium]
MRVNKGHSLSVLNIVNSHSTNECRFTGTGFSENVCVTEAIYPLLHTKNRHMILIFGLGKKVVEMSFAFRNIFVDRKIDRSFSFEGLSPSYPLYWCKEYSGQMIECGNFSII